MAEKNNEPQTDDLSSEEIAEKREQSGNALEEGEPVQKITGHESGAKRDSYFKKRDYE